jgi:hypothetical protein
MDGTRVGILRDLLLWCRDEHAPCVFWLDGMAGTGKSAIARTFSRSLRKENLLGGSFFCSRGSAVREDTKRIIPTLAASLARRDSGYRDALSHALDDNKDLTVHSNLDEQLEQFLNTPLRKARGQMQGGLVLVIDALDECANEDLMRELLGRLLALDTPLPVKLFLTSRPEPHIRNEFGRSNSNTSRVFRLHHIEDHIVQADIRLYFTNRMEEIRKTRPELTAEPWPSSFDIEKLTSLADALFIYAFTAAEYIRENPRSRLKALTALVPAVGLPFHNPLDALYSHILSSATNPVRFESSEVDVLKRILAVILAVRKPLTMSSLACLLDFSTTELRTTLNRLHAVIRVPPENDNGTLATFHASFRDFLTDLSRGQAHTLALSDGHTELAERCITRMSDDLHFNLAQCTTSYLPNVEQQLSAIPVALLYSCLDFPYHLSSATDSKIPSLLVRLHDVFLDKFMFWLEVLSASGKVDQASIILSRLTSDRKLVRLFLVLKDEITLNVNVLL